MRFKVKVTAGVYKYLHDDASICMDGPTIWCGSGLNVQAQRRPLASRVEREERVRIAAPHRAEKHGGGSLERSG